MNWLSRFPAMVLARDEILQKNAVIAEMSYCQLPAVIIHINPLKPKCSKVITL